jgi:hypothetical protein
MPGETIYIVGQFHFDSAGKCGAGQKKLAFFGVFYDTTDPTLSKGPSHEVAEGVIFDFTGTEPASAELPISSFDVGSIPPPSSPTTRTLTMFVSGACETGPGSISASNVKLDVIGVK